MRNAKVSLVKTKTNINGVEVLRGTIILKSSGEDSFNMGNSSFVFNHTGLYSPRLNYINPKYTMLMVKPETYKAMPPIITAFASNTATILQLRINSPGPQVDVLDTVAEIEWDIVGNELIKWRTSDCAIVTPDFQTILTEWV